MAPIGFDGLPGWSRKQAQEAWPAFLASARAVLGGSPLRPARRETHALRRLCALAEQAGPDADADAFFRASFRPRALETQGFLTAYYEPELEARLTPAQGFQTPVYPRPPDLIDLLRQPALRPDGWDRRIEGARLCTKDRLTPYWSRAEIDQCGVPSVRPIAWVRDAVDLFYAQVQGSARVVTPNQTARLIYDGRNGRPYTSIGRILLDRKALTVEEMSVGSIKTWLRAAGLKDGDLGRQILHCNESYIFFRLDTERGGPIGGQGIDLFPLRSIAIDRSIWPYGAPFWIAADIPSAGMSPERGRLWIAQDTGSAIVGPARFDLFVGSGQEAERIAGAVRHAAQCFVLEPWEG